jgi:hypothetical protein
MNMQIEKYVWRVSRRLRGLRGEQRREIRRDLRTHLRSASAEVGVAEAIARMGDPARVAADYADAEAGRRLRWRPRAGLVAAVLTYLILVVLQQREIRLVRAAHWGDFDPWSADLWLIRLSGNLERSLVLDIHIQRIAYLLLPLIAFALVARVWRSRPSFAQSLLRGRA